MTFLLRDTWGGNSKTCLVATVSPSGSSLSETVSTLNFAQRAKLIKNKAVLNENTCGTLAALQAEVSRLKSELEQQKSLSKSSKENEIQHDQTDEIAAMRRRSDMTDEVIKHLENKVTQEEKVVKTLKRKVQEETMVRKFKQRRLDYIQRRDNGVYIFMDSILTLIQILTLDENCICNPLDFTEDDQISILREEISMLQKQLATPSPEAIEWKIAYEDLKDEVEKRRKDGEVDERELQKQNSDLEATVQRLVTSKFELEERNSDLTKRSFETQDEIDSILKDVDRQESKMISLQDDLEDKRNELEKCEKRAEDARMKLNQMEVQIQKAKDDLLKNEEERQKLQQESDSMSLEVQHLKKVVEEKDKKICEVEKLSKEYENELLYTIDELGKRIDGGARVDLLQQHLDEAIEERKAIETELEGAASSIALHESTIRELEQNMITLTSEKENILRERESDAHDVLKRRTAELEGDLVKITNEKTTLESSLSTATSTLREKSEKISELEEKIEQIEIENNENLQQLDSNSSQIFDNKNTIEELQLKIDSMKTEKEHDLLSVQDEKKALETMLSGELEKIKNDLTQIEKEKSELHMGIKSLQDEKEATMKEVQSLRMSLKETEAKLESSQNASSSLLQSVREESLNLERDLCLKISHLEEEREGFLDKIAKLDDSNVKIKDSQKETNERILERDDEISSLKLKILKIQEEFNEASEDSVTQTNLLQDQLKLALLAKTSLEKSLNDMNLASDSIRKELSEQIKLSNEKDLKCHEEVKISSALRKSYDEKMGLLQNKYETLDADGRQIKLELNKSKNANTDLKDKYELLVYEKSRLEKQVQHYEDRREEARINAKNKAAEINEENTNAMILKKEKRILNLEKELHLAESKLLVVQTERKASMSSEEKISRSLLEYKDRIVLLKREKASIEFELETLQEDQNTLSEQLITLGAENDTLSIENAELKALIEKMNEDKSSCNSIAESVSTCTKKESSSYERYHHEQTGTPAYKNLSSKMDSMLKRVSNTNSPEQSLLADDSFDESMFLPNNDKQSLVQDDIMEGIENDTNKENQVISTDKEAPTPSKNEYGIKRKPLSVKKMNSTPSRSPLGSISKKRTGLPHSSNHQKFRSNWMVFDNKRLFEK